METRRGLLHVALLVGGSLALAVGLGLVLGDGRFVAEEIHSTMEALGVFAAIATALVLLEQRGSNEVRHEYFILALGLAGMGLLDGAHAASRIHFGFVRLHSFASLVGGLGFALLWLPEWWLDRLFESRRIAAAAVAALALAVTFATVNYPAFVPMLRGTQFTSVAVAVNVVAGILFLVGSVKLAMDSSGPGGFVFRRLTVVAALFGASGLEFAYSSPWSGTWWLWHVLRLAAYMLTLALVAASLRQLYAQEGDIAATLQESLVPSLRSVPGLGLGQVYQTATTEPGMVGGDFYDVFNLGDGRVGVLIGDVSGKGIAAARLTMMVKSVVEAFACKASSVEGAMTDANNVVERLSSEDAFVTVFLGVLHVETGILTYCDAGHPFPVIRRRDGGVEFLSSASPALGMLPDFTYSSGSTRLGPGDMLVAYTDGVTEARRGDEFFAEDRLAAAVARADPKLDAAGLADYLFAALTDFTGGRFRDDAAILTLSLTGQVARRPEKSAELGLERAAVAVD